MIVNLNLKEMNLDIRNSPQFGFKALAIESISYKVDKEKLTINLLDSLIEVRTWLQIA
jgi:hypothetical protein